MGNIRPTIDHYPRNEQMGEWEIPYLVLNIVCHVNPGNE